MIILTPNPYYREKEFFILIIMPLDSGGEDNRF
jgi:hypothetical protein